jgi:hypothetical protein
MHRPDDYIENDLPRLESELGPRLRSGLAAPETKAPQRLDVAVAGMARMRADEVRRQLTARSRRLRPVWAAAAAVLLAVGAWTAHSLNRPAAMPGDLDGSGGVDIIDAYLLDRLVVSGGEAEGSCDLNGDGRVDRADVRALAGRAVALDNGGWRPAR